MRSAVRIKEKEKIGFRKKNDRGGGKKTRIGRLIRRGIPLYLMFAIPAVWYILFRYLPMIGVSFAFMDFKPNKLFQSDWVGLKHFNELFHDSDYWRVFGNTVALGGLNIVVNFTLPIVFALMLNEIRHKWFRRAAQTISYLPHFVSVVALANVMFLMLDPRDGIINRILIDIMGKPIYFRIEEGWFRALYIIFWAWKEMGWGTIIYLAAMSSIDPQLYEAARLDGATRFRRIWSITLPSIIPVIGVMLILNMPSVISADFETVMLFQNIDNLSKADVVSTYIFRMTIKGLGNEAIRPQYSYATAVGLFSSLLSLLLIVISNYTSKKLGGVSIW